MSWQAELYKYIYLVVFVLYVLLLVTCREILRTVVKEKDCGVKTLLDRPLSLCITWFEFDVSRMLFLSFILVLVVAVAWRDAKTMYMYS